MTSAARPPAPASLRADEQESALRARNAIPERSLKTLLRRLTLIAKSTDADETAREITSLTLELETFMLNVSRIEAVAHQTTQQEIYAYEKQVQLIEKEHEEASEAIEALKRELIDVQLDRQNKLEYDGLASEILKYGSRDELETMLKSISDDIYNLQSESHKFSEIMETSQERFDKIALQLEALRADVGHEIGERERRAVERGGQEEDEQDNKKRSGSQDGEADEEANTTDVRNSTVLNPSAPAFQPTSRRSSSKPTSDITSHAKREAREDPELAPRHKRVREEGEVSDANASDDDEEGAA